MCAIHFLICASTRGSGLFFTKLSLHAQVYYLDSIDFGSHNVQAHGYPRIAHYSKEKIKELIELDKSRDPNPSSIVYGATQVFIFLPLHKHTVWTLI